MKGPRPTRFTTLSCNYHHKVDFTSSKSPRKGMLHFADPSPRPRAPFSATLGLRGTYGETTLASSRPLSATPSPFDQRAPSFPFRATLPFDRIGNVKTCRGLPFTPPRIPEIADPPSREYILFLALARRENKEEGIFSILVDFCIEVFESRRGIDEKVGNEEEY